MLEVRVKQEFVGGITRKDGELMESSSDSLWKDWLKFKESFLESSGDSSGDSSWKG